MGFNEAKVTRVLRVLNPLTATLSLALQAVAISTNYWLHSRELMPKLNNTGPKDFIAKYTVSGLWKICYTDPGNTDMHCMNIDYFPKEEYQSDPNDSTMAMPYAVLKAVSLLFLSTFLLILAQSFCCYGHFFRKKRICTFISGIFFILAGLMILGGLIIYISTFKAEVKDKLLPQSALQGPLFFYSYGFSFLMAVSAFMTSELAGTFAIFLYIYWHRVDWNKKEERRQYTEFLRPPPPPNTDEFIDHLPQHHSQHCRRHAPRMIARKCSRTMYDFSRENSPGTSLPNKGRSNQSSNPMIPLSESMKDLSYYNLPVVSRDTTCNTVSTTADINRDFSYETLRRTTPV